MKIDQEFKTIEITVMINDYLYPSQSYSKDKGMSREMSMKGHIDDPGVGPLGDIYENDWNSNFSWAPINIEMQLDSGGWIKEFIEKLDETAIGNIAIRKNVEVTTFKMDGQDIINPPVDVWLALPSKLFSSVEETLKNNKKSGKLGRLKITVRVAKNQVVLNNTDWNSRRYLKVKDLDVSGDCLELCIFEFNFCQTVLDIEQSKQKRVKTIDSKAEKSVSSIILNNYDFFFDTSRGRYERINIEGKTTKNPYGYKSELIDVSIELQEFWQFSEDLWSGYELPEKSFYGRYRYSNDLNHLSLTLAHHPEDFEDQIKPLLLRLDSIHVRLSVSFAEKLNFDADQEGNVVRFLIASQNIEKINLQANEQEVIEKLTNIDRKISDYVNSLDERFDSVEKVIRHDASQNMREIEGIKKQMALPRDILSRIVLKIPIIGSILRFLAR